MWRFVCLDVCECEYIYAHKYAHRCAEEWGTACRLRAEATLTPHVPVSRASPKLIPSNMPQPQPFSSFLPEDPPRGGAALTSA